MEYRKSGQRVLFPCPLFGGRFKLMGFLLCLDSPDIIKKQPENELLNEQLFPLYGEFHTKTQISFRQKSGKSVQGI